MLYFSILHKEKNHHFPYRKFKQHIVYKDRQFYDSCTDRILNYILKDFHLIL